MTVNSLTTCFKTTRAMNDKHVRIGPKTGIWGGLTRYPVVG